MEDAVSRQDDAWFKGQRAAACGEPMDSNPYRGGMVHIAWMSGWIDENNKRAKREDDDA